MTQAPQVAIVTPLTVGAGAVLCTIFIHALALGATVNFFRRETRLGRAGMMYLIDLTIVVLVMSFAFAAHLIEVAVWAWLFMICGQFQEFGAAYYHSAVNYSTLGYGDVIMAPSWKLLGTTRGSRSITDVRGIDRDDFCRHSAFDSDSICGSQRYVNMNWSAGCVLCSRTDDGWIPAARDDGPLSSVLDTLFGSWRSAFSLRLNARVLPRLTATELLRNSRNTAWGPKYGAPNVVAALAQSADGIFGSAFEPEGSAF